MRVKAAGAAALGLVGAFVVVGPGVAGNNDFRNKYPNSTASKSCTTGAITDTVEYAGPQMMWPPNHKLQDLTFVARNGGADTSTELVVSGAFADVAGGDGGPQHDPDALPGTGSGTGEATAVAQARSERSGKGEGRTYTFTARGVFDGGTRSCTLTVEIVVPHDMRGGASWK